MERRVDLVLVGPPGWNEDLESILGALPRGVQERVKRLGWVPRDDLAALYAGAGVFCFPSLLEGFGFPVVEAMAHGTPVVTSRGTSTEELAEGGAGLLVDPTDVDDVASALSSVLENEALAGRLAARRAGAGDALHVGDDGRSRLERLRRGAQLCLTKWAMPPAFGRRTSVGSRSSSAMRRPTPST